MPLADTIIQRFNTRGGDAYFGEDVSQLEHALQAAWLADQEHASGAEVVAALLHDIGHMLHGGPEDIAEQGTDARHEDVGYEWLRAHLPAEVADPVRLHVAAKRYLCAVNPDYAARLSPASIRSLELQGGPMTPTEVAEFEAEPGFRSAVRVRLWDDRAKIPGLTVPPVEHYRDRILALEQ